MRSRYERYAPVRRRRRVLRERAALRQYACYSARCARDTQQEVCREIRARFAMILIRCARSMLLEFIFRVLPACRLSRRVMTKRDDPDDYALSVAQRAALLSPRGLRVSFATPKERLAHAMLFRRCHQYRAAMLFHAATSAAPSAELPSVMFTYVAPCYAMP